MSSPESPLYSADEALARLREGNARFQRGEARVQTAQKDILAELTKGQRPWATVIGCSDSRVPPELVFDVGFGELFVIRVAGNVIDAAVIGSIQYAALHLKTQLFVVMGHDGCGAVQAALAIRNEGASQPSRIALLLEGILPGLAGVNPSLPAPAQLSAGVEANVRWSMRQLLESPEGQARIREGVLRLVGAVYELETGRVRFLP